MSIMLQAAKNGSKYWSEPEPVVILKEFAESGIIWS